ncbi:MAG: Holliday junction resolvase RuvX [Oscillospiraceae bacterium]|jgi:putative Holliday junction resolvase|nr:Holliday junction resolvase RuvX [Oscillospiraceae bacterium]
MRIMAVDYGDARIGLAVSDETATLCGEAWTLPERSMARAADKIVREAAERGVSLFVLGYPKNMDGTLGPRAEKSAEFKALLEARSDIPVRLWDERRTTVAAHEILRLNGRKMKSHRARVDAVAASLILEGYLGTLK